MSARPDPRGGTTLPPTGIGAPVLAGALVILCTFGGLLLWSGLAPLSSAIIARGTVVVDSSRKTVQHLEGGIVRVILVRDGDHVVQGQVLLRLDDTRLQAAMSTLRPLLEMSRAQRARLLAEREGADDVTFPEDLARSGERMTAEILRDQRRVFQVRRAALRSRLASLANRRAQASETVAGLISQVVSQAERIDLTQQELADVARLAAKGYAPAKRTLELRRAVAALEGERAELDSRTAENRHAVEHYELEAVQVQNSFMEAVESELQSLDKGIYDLTERMRTLTDQLEHLAVRAPVEGVIVGMEVHTLGGVIAPGAKILDIVPANDRLVVEARISPNDVTALRQGLPAEIRFPSLNRRDLPKLTGSVAVVSADLIVDPLTRTSYFAARIDVDASSLTEQHGITLKPGMPVDVLVVKGERTLLDYLVEPMKQILIRALRE
jgi:epimerase transport system membrane fusion protein